MSLPDTARVAEELPAKLRPVFAPLVRRAMGLALGTVGAGALFVAAVVPMLSPLPAEDFTFVFLIRDNFLPGYGPTLTGALAGVLWGFGIGFVMGWFVAAARNLFLAVWVAVVGAKERARANRDFLDQI